MHAWCQGAWPAVCASAHLMKRMPHLHARTIAQTGRWGFLRARKPSVWQQARPFVRWPPAAARCASSPPAGCRQEGTWNHHRGRTSEACVKECRVLQQCRPSTPLQRAPPPLLLQLHVLTLPGAPVALAAHGHLLAAVWHAGPPTATGDQCLLYVLHDVAGAQSWLACRGDGRSGARITAHINGLAPPCSQSNASWGRGRCRCRRPPH